MHDLLTWVKVQYGGLWLPTKRKKKKIKIEIINNFFIQKIKQKER